MKDYMLGDECIAFAVGGTGGHVIPAVKMAKCLPGEGERFLIGVGIEENPYVMKKDFARFNVLGMNFSKGIFSGLIAIFKGVKKSVKVLKKQKCTHVIGMGGFHSLPVLIAALFLRVPITLYEPNIIPGKVNKFFSFFSKRTLILFDEVKKHIYGKSKLLNLTMREEKTNTTFKGLLREEFGLDPDVTTILIFGGSKGAKTLNTLIHNELCDYKEKFQVIHLTGSPSNLKDEYEKLGIRSFVTTFISKMHIAWKVCDFAICRAGAGAIRESLIYETPVILVPYPFSMHNHQKHNADFLKNTVGCAKVFEEKDFSKEEFTKALDYFFQKKSRDEMKNNIKKYIDSREGVYLDALLL